MPYNKEENLCGTRPAGGEGDLSGAFPLKEEEQEPPEEGLTCLKMLIRKALCEDCTQQEQTKDTLNMHQANIERAAASLWKSCRGDRQHHEELPYAFRLDAREVRFPGQTYSLKFLLRKSSLFLKKPQTRFSRKRKNSGFLGKKVPERIARLKRHGYQESPEEQGSSGVLAPEEQITSTEWASRLQK